MPIRSIDQSIESNKSIDRRAFYPDVYEGHMVEDPIFGRTGKASDVPYMAHVDDADMRKARVLEVLSDWSDRSDDQIDLQVEESQKKDLAEDPNVEIAAAESAIESKKKESKANAWSLFILWSTWIFRQVLKNFFIFIL